jgi:hypothetical protein
MRSNYSVFDMEQHPRDPVNRPFIIVCVVSSVIWMTLFLVVWPLAILDPKWEAHLIAKAKATPAWDAPSFHFMPIPYTPYNYFELREIAPFNITNLWSCLGWVQDFAVPDGRHRHVGKTDGKFDIGALLWGRRRHSLDQHIYLP